MHGINVPYATFLKNSVNSFFRPHAGTKDKVKLFFEVRPKSYFMAQIN